MSEKLDSRQVWERIRNGASPSEFALKVFSESDIGPAQKSVQSIPDLDDLDADSQAFVRRVLAERQAYEARILAMGWTRDTKGAWLPPQSTPDVAASTITAELARFDAASSRVRDLDAQTRTAMLGELSRLSGFDLQAEKIRRRDIARELARAAGQLSLLD